MDLFTTIIVAALLIFAALALIGIGWLITGKMKIRPGSCGRVPDQKRGKKCGDETKCFLCEDDKDDLQ